jgi:hypothetical protein
VVANGSSPIKLEFSASVGFIHKASNKRVSVEIQIMDPIKWLRSITLLMKCRIVMRGVV